MCTIWMKPDYFSEHYRIDLLLFGEKSSLEQRNLKTDSQSLFASTMSMSLNFRLLLDILRSHVASKILTLPLYLLRGFITKTGGWRVIFSNSGCIPLTKPWNVGAERSYCLLTTLHLTLFLQNLAMFVWFSFRQTQYLSCNLRIKVWSQHWNVIVAVDSCLGSCWTWRKLLMHLLSPSQSLFLMFAI